jgi:hypothetical protein
VHSATQCSIIVARENPVLDRTIDGQPDEAFVLQMARLATDANDDCLRSSRFLISDWDTRWIPPVWQALTPLGFV